MPENIKIPQLTKAPTRPKSLDKDTFIETVVIYWSDHNKNWTAYACRTSLVGAGETVNDAYEAVEAKFWPAVNEHINDPKYPFLNPAPKKVIDMSYTSMRLYDKMNQDLEDDKHYSYVDYITYKAVKPEHITFFKNLKKESK